MYQLIGDDFATMYNDIAGAVVHQGDETSPRGMMTREILDASFMLTDPRNGWAAGTGRGLVPAIAFAEALQLIAGESHPELMVRIAPRFADFRNGGVFLGAYGPPVGEQIVRVRNLLMRDPDTRQAIITALEAAAHNPEVPPFRTGVLQV